MVAQILFVAAAVALDQYVKHWASTVVRESGSLPGINGIFEFIYTENRGAAFSSFSGQRVFLLAVTAVAMLAIIWILFSKKVKEPLGKWSLLMILAGGIGNFIDRIYQGYVVDMIRLTFMNFAIFNVADCFATVGTALFAIYLIKYGFDSEQETAAAAKTYGNVSLPESKNAPDSGTDNGGEAL